MRKSYNYTLRKETEKIEELEYRQNYRLRGSVK